MDHAKTTVAEAGRSLTGLMTFYLWNRAEIAVLPGSTDEDPFTGRRKTRPFTGDRPSQFRHRPEREVPAADEAHRNPIDDWIPNILTLESCRVL